MVISRRHTTSTGRLRSERGVSLIHVAISIFVLTGFCAFVLDHGVLMLARGQSQNVADMAAIAGATARAMDEPGNAAPPVNGLTEKAIQNVIDSHKVFAGTSANIGRTWNFGPCPPGVTGWCVRVDVFRDGSNGSTVLPAYFANLFGINDQRIKATATAVAATANGTNCMKPWLIPDKWLEVQGAPDSFDPPGDTYVPYNYQANTPGSGYSLADIGTNILLKPGNPKQAISPSDFYEIETATDYKESIINCLITKNIGDTIEVLNGNRKGPTKQGVDVLTANGPVDVVVGVFNPAAFEAQRRQSGNFDLQIVNMISVRITGIDNNGTVQGVISGGVGTSSGNGGAGPSGVASLIKSIQLVR